MEKRTSEVGNITSKQTHTYKKSAILIKLIMTTIHIPFPPTHTRLIPSPYLNQLPKAANLKETELPHVFLDARAREAT